MSTIGLPDIEILARQESARLHHHFIGVEHLFIALTQLKDGLTVPVLEQHGLTPRYVRYSIRESVGQYEDRRYWGGFPETPRAVQVLAQTRNYAGIHPPTERDLLLAILDEGDSVVIRVLHEMGANRQSLRLTAANWPASLRSRLPDVPIEGPVDLNDEERHVLRMMFRAYDRVRIVRELEGGYDGARMLLIRPVRAGGHLEAPVIVKLDNDSVALAEGRRYDLAVKGLLPVGAARLVESPVVPDESRLGGLRYAWIGQGDDADPASLRELAAQRDPQELSSFIVALAESCGPTWWQQHTPYRFSAWREYEHVLPPALILDAVTDSRYGAVERVLKPLEAWSRTRHVSPGQVVAADGFTVEKVDIRNDVLHLCAGGQPEAIYRSGKLEVRGLGVDKGAFFRGQVVDHVVGRVAQTRDDLLLRAVQALEPESDLRAPTIASGHDMVNDLPNPLTAIPALLTGPVAGTRSAIHGNLHLGNVMVGAHSDAWFIDFSSVRDGHVLADWAMLEASLLVEYVVRHAPPGWDGVWGVVALLHSINRGEDRILQERHRVAQALTTVMTVRKIAGEYLGTAGQWDDYHVALALVLLRALEWQPVSLDGRRLAFLAAALSMAEAGIALDEE